MSAVLVIVLLIGIAELMWLKRTQINLWLKIGGPIRSHWFWDANRTIGKLFDLCREYGPMQSLWIGGKLVVFVTDADHAANLIISPLLAHRVESPLKQLAGNGLMSSNGERWQYFCKLIKPALTYQHKTRHHVAKINMHARLLISNLVHKSNGDQFDIKPILQLFVLDLMTDILMDTKTEFQADKNLDFFDFLDGLMAMAGERMFNPLKHRVSRLNPTYAKTLDKIIENKLNNAQRAANLETSTSDEPVDLLGRLTNLLRQDGKISADDLMEHCKSTLIHSYSTTVSALSFVLLMLAMHPDHQQRIRQEIEALGDAAADDDHAARLPHLDRCISEALRLFPPIAYAERVTAEPIHMKDDYIIPPGTAFIIGTLHIQRSARHFAHPDAFAPDLHFPNAPANDDSDVRTHRRRRRRHPFAYFPFSVGQRACAGSQLAQTVLRLAVVRVLREFRLATAMRLGDIELRHDVALTSQHGFWVTVAPAAKD